MSAPLKIIITINTLPDGSGDCRVDAFWPRSETEVTVCKNSAIVLRALEVAKGITLEGVDLQEPSLVVPIGRLPGH